MSDWYGQDLQVVSSEEVFEHFVLDDEKSIIEYLKSEWLESALSQMVSARVGLGISQKTLAENIGKSQPAIARLEKGADVKLSVLWDYYAGLGLTPSLHVALENLEEVKTHVREFRTRNRTSIKSSRQRIKTTYLFDEKFSSILYGTEKLPSNTLKRGRRSQSPEYQVPRHESRRTDYSIVSRQDWENF